MQPVELPSNTHTRFVKVHDFLLAQLLLNLGKRRRTAAFYRLICFGNERPSWRMAVEIFKTWHVRAMGMK